MNEELSTDFLPRIVGKSRASAAGLLLVANGIRGCRTRTFERKQVDGEVEIV
jgi:hypothetical protein